ncbi:MAG: hypothetical protein NTV46_20720 [Verrucomicrobia bacterium]|nr:hypothetical protein [Verrucomicrobiota bacterium]
MNVPLPRSLGAALFACAVAFPLVSCSKNTAQKAEIASLQQEIADRDTNIQDLETRSTELEQKNSELESKVSEAEQKASDMEEQLTRAKSELETMQKAKATEQAQASTKTPAQILDATKEQINKQLPAIVSIEGDVTRGRGVLIQADGKTWLYSAAQVMSGNTKLTIKSADGTALTKFGEFQVATDTSLVRLEIQQEIPVKITMDNTASVDASTPLVAVIAEPNGGALQALDCRIAKTTGNDFEIETYGTQQSQGCPLLAAGSGKVIAIFCTGTTSADLTLWQNPQQTTGSDARTRAARLNRPIEWKTSSLNGFLDERRKIDDLNKTTRLLHALASVRVAGTFLQLGGALGGGSTTMTQVLQQNATNPLVVALKKVQTDLSNTKVRVAERDITRRLANILGDAQNAGTRQVQEFKGTVISFYHRPIADTSLKWRTEADQALKATLLTLAR